MPETAMRPRAPFWVVGHRGSPIAEVENTLPSFAKALDEDGANGLELDICVTRDGELVVWHDFDPTESRATFRRWGLEPDVQYRPVTPSDSRFRKKVSELTLDELRQHYGYAPKSPWAGRVDAHVPTLGEFFDFATTRRSLGLVFLDVKLPPDCLELLPPLLARLDELLARVEPHFRVVLETAELEVARQLQRLAPERDVTLDIEPPAGVVFDESEASAARAALEHGLRCATAQKPRSITLMPFRTHRRIVCADLELLAELERDGKEVPDPYCCFTINEAEEMRELIDCGVRCIQTDAPGLLRTILDEEAAPVAELGLQSILARRMNVSTSATMTSATTQNSA